MTEKASKEAERISVRDANQGFSRLIADVEKGAKFIVTKNNREVARIEPVENEEDRAATARRQAAWERLARMMKEARCSTDGWTYKGKRDELHDRSV